MTILYPRYGLVIKTKKYPLHTNFSLQQLCASVTYTYTNY